MLTSGILAIIVAFLFVLLLIVAGINILCNTFTNGITKNQSKLSRIVGMFFGTLFIATGVVGIVALIHTLER